MLVLAAWLITELLAFDCLSFPDHWRAGSQRKAMDPKVQVMRVRTSGLFSPSSESLSMSLLLWARVMKLFAIVWFELCKTHLRSC